MKTIYKRYFGFSAIFIAFFLLPLLGNEKKRIKVAIVPILESDDQ